MHAAGLPKERMLEVIVEVFITMTKLDWIKLVIIKGIKKTRIEHYDLPLPRFAQYLRTWGEAGDLKQEMMGKWGTVESQVCLLVMPPIMKVTATGCGTQQPRRFLRHVTWYFLTGCSYKHLKTPRKRTRNRIQKTLNQKVSGKTKGGYCNYGI
jgi:hypothetical protein